MLPKIAMDETLHIKILSTVKALINSFLIFQKLRLKMINYILKLIFGCKRLTFRKGEMSSNRMQRSPSDSSRNIFKKETRRSPLPKSELEQNYEGESTQPSTSDRISRETSDRPQDTGSHRADGSAEQTMLPTHLVIQKDSSVPNKNKMRLQTKRKNYWKLVSEKYVQQEKNPSSTTNSRLKQNTEATKDTITDHQVPYCLNQPQHILEKNKIQILTPKHLPKEEHKNEDIMLLVSNFKDNVKNLNGDIYNSSLQPEENHTMNRKFQANHHVVNIGHVSRIPRDVTLLVKDCNFEELQKSHYECGDGLCIDNQKYKHTFDKDFKSKGGNTSRHYRQNFPNSILKNHTHGQFPAHDHYERKKPLNIGYTYYESNQKFEKKFRSFAKVGNRRLNGITITSGGHERWMKQVSETDMEYAYRMKVFPFRTFTGAKAVLTVAEYKDFLMRICKTTGEDYFELIQKLGNCSVPKIAMQESPVRKHEYEIINIQN